MYTCERSWITSNTRVEMLNWCWGDKCFSTFDCFWRFNGTRMKETNKPRLLYIFVYKWTELLSITSNLKDNFLLWHCCFYTKRKKEAGYIRVKKKKKNHVCKWDSVTSSSSLQNRCQIKYIYLQMSRNVFHFFLPLRIRFENWVEDVNKRQNDLVHCISET